MNLGRAISGLLLSFVFLSFSVYSILFIGQFFDSYVAGEQKPFTASLSDGVENFSQQDSPTTNVQSVTKLMAKIDVNAESAISIESDLSGNEKVIFSKTENEILPIASLTKLMTAVVVLDNYDLSQKITVSDAADSQDPMKIDVKKGDTMQAESFLDVMIIGSSNKSAYALAESIGVEKFVKLMNNKAKEIGLRNTRFVDPTGLSSQNVSTAGDLAKLAEYILKNYPKIAQVSKEKEFSVPGFGKVINTDQLLGEVPDIVCSKTGFTNVAKGCLLLVVNNPKSNDYFINVVLGAEDRFLEMKKIINWSNLVCN